LLIVRPICATINVTLPILAQCGSASASQGRRPGMRRTTKELWDLIAQAEALVESKGRM